jgi:DNase/tRNase domain of colicin-like bacteriocin
MNPRTWARLALFLLATACATNGSPSLKADTSDTGSRLALVSERGPLQITRSPSRREPVEVSQAEYHAAMVQLARQLRHTLPPRVASQLAIIPWGSPGQPDERAALVREYFQWCQQRDTPGDCLALLRDGLYLTQEAKQSLAFALATRGVWEGTAAVIDEVLDPVQLQIALVSTITMTLALLAIPEPVSKVIVLALTASMVAYVGWDTLVGLIEGWQRLVEECRRARTFAELRAAGERYGLIMGEKVTRLLILAATAALASGGSKSINGGLPGLTQASRMATAEGLSFEVLGAVRSVKVTGRILTVSMESNALLMANQGMGNGNSKPPSASSPAPAASSSKYRLSSIESWRKPRLTKDGRILPFKGTRQPVEPIPNLGKNRAGQTVSDGKATLRFDENGFPEFETKFEILLEDSHIGSSRALAHRKAANEKLFAAIKNEPSLAEELGLSRTQVENLLKSDSSPPGYIWHHHQDVGRMQLVAQSQHRLANPHTGGMAIWGGGYPP